MAVSTPAISSAHIPAAAGSSLYDKLNSTWHERALQDVHGDRSRSLG